MTAFKMNRRRFLAMAGGGIAAGGAAYVYARGVRYPLLRLAGTAPPTGSSAAGVEVLARGAVFQDSGRDGHGYRAFVPEPAFTVRGDGGSARLVVENIHPGASLEVDGNGAARRAVSEDRAGLTREIAVEATGETRLAWRFPRVEQYRFAAIGDSGGGTELRWVLHRAADLGADFLVHLGDIYYEEGDFERAAEHLNGADIPTYAAIGNHDFHLGWQALYPTFHRVVGPSNSVFALGGVEFVNIDTAADYIPANRGRRARIIDNLKPIEPGAGIRDRVAFTHTPFRDPDPERGHAVSREAEVRWLRERFLASGTRTLLAGHIHIKAEHDDGGLYTYISGQGLGHADLIGPRPYRQYAEILLGDVSPGEPVRYQWQPLEMPFEAHCNARNLDMLDAIERADVKARLMEACGKG